MAKVAQNCIDTENYDDRWLVSTGRLPAIIPFLNEEQQSKYLGRDDTPITETPCFKRRLTKDSA